MKCILKAMDDAIRSILPVEWFLIYRFRTESPKNIYWPNEEVSNRNRTVLLHRSRLFQRNLDQ